LGFSWPRAALPGQAPVRSQPIRATTRRALGSGPMPHKRPRAMRPPTKAASRARIRTRRTSPLRPGAARMQLSTPGELARMQLQLVATAVRSTRAAGAPRSPARSTARAAAAASTCVRAPTPSRARGRQTRTRAAVAAVCPTRPEDLAGPAEMVIGPATARTARHARGHRRATSAADAGG
jgi:hypothetical protein